VEVAPSTMNVPGVLATVQALVRPGILVPALQVACTYGCGFMLTQRSGSLTGTVYTPRVCATSCLTRTTASCVDAAAHRSYRLRRIAINSSTHLSPPGPSASASLVQITCSW